MSMTSTPSDMARPRLGLAGAHLHAAETMLLVLCSLVALLAFAISYVSGQSVAWGAFGKTFLPAIGLILVGLYLRGPKQAARVAKLAIGIAIFILFGGVMAILIYTRFPVSGPLLDPHLAALDSALGLAWPDLVTQLASWPQLGTAMAHVYHSSLPQLLALIMGLALMGRFAQLDRALLAGCLSLVFTVALWWIWPSIGPSAFNTISPEIAGRIGLVHDAHMGDRLLRYVQDGAPVIQPSEIMGTIAFPSYHTVMMIVVLWYTRGTWMVWPALAANVLMVPAILIHGGHYSADVLGGLITFTLAAWIAARIVPETKASKLRS